MGNILPLPCVCHCCCHNEVNDDVEGATAVAGGAKKRRKQRSDRSRNVVVPVVDDTAEDGDSGRAQGWREQEAWPECRVEPAGRGEDGGVRVRIVMKRKDIAQLVARLEQRGPEERNTARIEEVVSAELAGCNSSNDGDGEGSGSGGGGTMMSPCRDAWRPRLSIIREN